MDASTFLSVLKVVQDQGYSRAAALTFLIYDILALLEDEIELIWRRKWSFTKVLYLIERYYGLIAVIIMIIAGALPNPSGKLCSTYIRAMSLAGSKFCVVVIDTICIIRIYALYESSKKVLAVLVAIALCEFTFGFYAIWQLTEFEAAPPRSSDPLLARAGCLTLAAEVTPLKLRMYLANCVFTTANSGLYFLLSLYKLRVYLVDRSSGRVRLPLLTKMSVISPLLRAFFRDAALTFLLLFGTMMLTTFASFYKYGIYYFATWPWLFVTYSFVGSRLVLNIRRAAVGKNTGICGMDSSRLAYSYGFSLPPIEFAERRVVSETVCADQQPVETLKPYR